MDLADDGLGKLALFTLLDLTFVAHPGVEDLLGLSGEGSALLELVSLSLKLGGFLCHVNRCSWFSTLFERSNLGNFKKLLGNLNNTTELLHILNAGLDGIGVVGTSRVQNILVLLRLTLSPLSIHGTAIFAESSEDTDQTECDDGFLVEHVKLVADGSDRKTGAGRQDGGLGNE